VEAREWCVTVKDRETRVDQAIYRPAYDTALAVLPKVRDEELIRKVGRDLEKANEAAERVIGDEEKIGVRIMVIIYIGCLNINII